jgi:ribosomal protein S7
MLRGILGKYNPIEHAKDATKLGKLLVKNLPPEKDPSLAQTIDKLARPPCSLLKHFSTILIKHGKRRDALLMRINTALKLKYGVPNPIEVAVDAITPIIRFYRPKNKKIWIPEAIWPKSSTGMAIRWIAKAASNRTYGQWKRPDLERGLTDEIEGILAGTSSLFTKKLACHKNPN